MRKCTERKPLQTGQRFGKITLEKRINSYGWDIEKALTTPLRKRGV